MTRIPLKPFALIVCLFTLLCLSSCSEDVITDREVVQRELEQEISEFNIERIDVYTGDDNRFAESTDTWTFENGFLIIDAIKRYDLDKVRSYERQFPNGIQDPILVIFFL